MKVPVKFSTVAVAAVALERVKTLAKHIKYELQHGLWSHCVIYEDQLQRLWPLHSPYREVRIAAFAEKYGPLDEVL